MSGIQNAFCSALKMAILSVISQKAIGTPVPDYEISSGCGPPRLIELIV